MGHPTGRPTLSDGHPSMSLRIRADIINRAIGLDPLSPRAVAWLEERVRPLGGDWKKTGSLWTFSLPIRAIPEDLLGTSGLVLYFGDRYTDIGAELGLDLAGRITLH